MTDNNKDTAKSFTTRVSGETWAKINKYKEYGKWNTNQFTNHALDIFFEIVESEEENPRLPLVCETIREMRRKRDPKRFTSEAQAEVKDVKTTQKKETPKAKEIVSKDVKTPSTGQRIRERMANVEKPWLKNLENS